MTQAAQQQDAEQEPNFYQGTSFLVDEILLGMNVLTAKVRNLKQGNTSGSAVQQKLAAEDIAKISGQIQSMAQTIARVTISHINRKPRV